MIGRQLNIVLEYMRNRLDGQREFIESVGMTLLIAQQLLDQAIEDKKAREEKQRLEREEKDRQLKEIALMAFEDKLMRNLMAAEKKKAQEEAAKKQADELAK